MNALRMDPSATLIASPRSPGVFLLVVLVFLALTTHSVRSQTPYFADDFSTNRVDTNRWRVHLPFTNPPASTVRPTNGMVELFRRGILEAVPPMPARFDLEGRFRFLGDADTLTLVFRSDLSVTNQEERRGVQAALQEATGRVFLVPEPYATTPVAGTYTIGRDTNVAFRVTDNGETVRLFVQDFFQPVVTANITNRRGNRLVIYNLNGTASRTRLDDLSVYPLETSVFLDDTLMRTGAVRRSTPVRLRFQSIFTNSVIFYTLDGSLPSFVSTEYTAPFSLSNSATIRAVAYSADFLASSLSSAIEFQYLPLVRLTNETPGGGVVTFTPTGPYFSNQVVTVSALAAPGWQFLRWEGAAAGTNATNQITMTNHLAVRAVFGTTPAFTVIGNGQVQTVPAGPILNYGTVTRLLALPAAGSYFLRWANSVTGSVSPATFTLTNPAPAVTALFSSMASNQVSLTVLLDGAGTVGVSPAANVFTNGQTVTLTARPDLNQVFLGWAGDGAGNGATNPLSLLLAGSKTVRARFAPAVRFETTSLRADSNGFRLTLTGGLKPGLELQRSTNLSDWATVLALTNVGGSMLFQHTEATNYQRLFYRVVGP